MHPSHSLGCSERWLAQYLAQNERQEECAFGVHLDSIQMQARLAPARISNFTACLARFKLGRHVSVGTCRRLLGLMVAASPVLPLGLLHMRPFLWWMKELRLHPTIPATRLIRVSRSCSRPLLKWQDPAFLQSGVRMGAIHHRHMITTDTSMTGWGAVYEGKPASGEWTGEFLSSHINCLELRAVFLALMYFLPVLREHHIIVRTDNMAVVSHINRQGGSRSRTLDRLACRLLLWSQDKFLSLRAVHVHVPPVAECQSVCVSTNKAESGSPMQSKGEQCPSSSHSPILALPDLVLGANSPPVSARLGDSDQAGPAVPASGQDLASSTRALEVVGMAHTGPRALINNLPVEVQETIASARGPSTRKLHSSKWGVFESWCLARAIDPVNCPVGPVLEFLQERLTAGAAVTTLRVYVGVIAARRELDEIPLGRHRMVSAFMRGVRRLRPTRPTAVPSWDLSVVLEGLVTAPFEPLESAPERILTLKVTLLLALTSLKRV